MTSDEGALQGAVAKAGRGLLRPKFAATLCVATLMLTGWIYLGSTVAHVARSGGAAALGPGMGIFDRFAHARGLGPDLTAALCRPMLGAELGLAGAGDLALVLLMWCAMALAMMIPTAAPMIMTYAGLAERNARAAERGATVAVLSAGYTSVWIGFALAASVLQCGLIRALALDPTIGAANGLFSGAVFMGAGAYQFSALKFACVTSCQRPSRIFLAHWSAAPAGAFRLGVRQGLYCLGCCWAMMAVMFAVGTMNVVWMAGLGTLMTLEKVSTTTRLSRITGAVLLAIGAVFIAAAVAAHWPGGGFSR